MRQEQEKNIVLQDIFRMLKGNFLDNVKQILLIAISTALIGEISINLLGNIVWFSLGSVVYYFALLFWDELSLIVTATATSICILVIKTVLLLMRDGTITWQFLLLPVLSQMVYYYFCSFNLMIFSVRTHQEYFANIFTEILFCDAVATAFGLLARNDLSLLRPPHDAFFSVMFAALFRSALTVSFFYIAQREKLDAAMRQEKVKYDQMLLLLTGFYTEAFFLRKSSSDIENTMARCYELYRSLHKERGSIPDGVRLSQQALDVAKDIHEIKKDYQRIIAGMNRLIKLDTVEDHMPFDDLVRVIIDSNRFYSIQQHKKINFSFKPEYHFSSGEFHSLISILNNLLSNAVEAIDLEGAIEVSVQLVGWHIFINVKDNGPGIDDADQQIIFAPGYTTKFSGNGMQSTGIGLTHVRSLVEGLGGEVKVASVPGETVFTLVLPRERVEYLPEAPQIAPGARGADILEK